MHKIPLAIAFTAVLLGSLVVPTAARTLGASAAPVVVASPQHAAQEFVKTFISALNSGMESKDFIGLATLYAPGATLTVSNPKGVTTLFHGRTQIIGFYQGVAKAENSPHFSIDQLRGLSRNVVFTYEHAGHPQQTAPARCTHLYVIKHGKIVMDDFVVFYPGQA